MSSYRKYLGKSFLDKAINGLSGIVEGISIDGLINNTELLFLAKWVEQHQEYANQHPFTELLPVLINSLSDGKLTRAEREEIIWSLSCNNKKGRTPQENGLRPQTDRRTRSDVPTLADAESPPIPPPSQSP